MLRNCKDAELRVNLGIEKSNNPDYPNDKNNIVAFKPLGNAAPQQPGEAPAWVNEDKPSATPAKPSL
jgi:hypothetical protein